MLPEQRLSQLCWLRLKQDQNCAGRQRIALQIYTDKDTTTRCNVLVKAAEDDKIALCFVKCLNVIVDETWIKKQNMIIWTLGDRSSV